MSGRARSAGAPIGGDRLAAEMAGSARMRGTLAAVRRHLAADRDGVLLYRNRRAEGPAGEGAFGIACFWAAEALARGGGSEDEARRALERLLSYANDVGLYGEEIDPATGEALGNFPQAFTHVGLIGAALSLEERARRGAPAGDRARAA